MPISDEVTRVTTISQQILIWDERTCISYLVYLLFKWPEFSCRLNEQVSFSDFVLCFFFPPLPTSRTQSTTCVLFLRNKFSKFLPEKGGGSHWMADRLWWLHHFGYIIRVRTIQQNTVSSRRSSHQFIYIYSFRDGTELNSKPLVSLRAWNFMKKKKV